MNASTPFSEESKSSLVEESKDETLFNLPAIEHKVIPKNPQSAYYES